MSMPSPSRSNFTKPGRRAVVLVPLEHRPALHARPLDRAELDAADGRPSPCRRNGCRGGAGSRSPPPRARARAAGSAAAVSRSGGPSSGTPSRAHVPFGPLEAALRAGRACERCVGFPTGTVVFSRTSGADASSSKASGPAAQRSTHLPERVGLAGRDAGRLRHLAQRRAGPVGDDVRDLRGAVASVALVDVLDHLFAALVLDVEVDVGRTVAFG